jgi:hypothetical protein
VVQIIGTLFMIVLVAAAFKAALLLLVIAGLIFRTKETIGLLLLGWLLVGFAAYPLPTLGGAVLLLCLSLYLKRKEKRQALLDPPDDPEQE